jgi:hypothetical protein
MKTVKFDANGEYRRQDSTKPVESDKNDAMVESRRQTVPLKSDTTVTLTYAQAPTETLKLLAPRRIPLNELEID